MKNSSHLAANKYLYQYVKQHIGLTLSVFLFGLAGSMSAFFLTLLVGDFFVLHFQLDSSKGRLLEMAGIHLSGHTSYFLVFILCISVKLLTQFAEKYHADRLSEGLVWQLKRKLFHAHLETRKADLPTKSKEKYVLNFNSEWRGISRWVGKGLVFPVKDLVFLFAGIMLIERIDSIIAVTIFLSIFLFAWFITGITRFHMAPLLNKRKANRAFLNFVTKVFYNKSSRQMMISNEQLQIEFECRASDSIRTNRKNQWWESLFASFIPILPFLIMGLILLEISLGFTQISGPQALVVILFLLLMQGALRRIFKAPALWRNGQLSLTKLIAVIEQPALPAKPDVIPLQTDQDLSHRAAGF